MSLVRRFCLRTPASRTHASYGGSRSKVPVVAVRAEDSVFNESFKRECSTADLTAAALSAAVFLEQVLCFPLTSHSELSHAISLLFLN